MNALFVKMYKTARKDVVGRYAGTGKIYHYKVSAKQAYNTLKLHLKVKALWDDNEYDEHYNPEGTVRFNVVPDEYCDYDNLAGDSFNPKANPDINPSLLERQEAEFKDRINRDGVWGIVGEYKSPICPHCNKGGDWIHADSVWGFVGGDWKESEDEIKAATLKAAGLWDEE